MPIRHPRRVVITGAGVISPVGRDVDTFWTSLLQGRSGIATIDAFDPAGLSTTIAAQVRDFDPLEYMPHKVSRRLDHFARYGLAAAVQAADEAKLAQGGDLNPRLGVLVSSGYGSSWLQQSLYSRFAERGPRGVPPYAAAALSADSPSAEIALRFGAAGPSGSMSTACATGTMSVGEAAMWIRTGRADLAIAGGCDDSITAFDMATTGITGALSRRNDEPERACRPFDRDRDGFVVGAGAAVVVLEEAEHALRRGAAIQAEVAGYAATTDAFHPTAPHPDGLGAATVMRLALRDAGLEPDAIDYINAHGTGTVLNDRIESLAIRNVFGARVPPISSIKALTGHMIGAAGTAELIATVKAIATGLVPPTFNCDAPEVEDLDYVPNQVRRMDVGAALSNSFGFGGHNAALVVRAWTP
ncbi:beta-ketoacyl-[acyl-carrier-protein] synthase family protein [Nonomuraea sp. NPDC059023]|uniref:beta-ketoacyl-[acyl-carrier-protein] synthase family protein n=1 Tax=unclassified Nonomuraea TaxID=2593643 RepID=UPI0036B4FC3A